MRRAEKVNLADAFTSFEDAWRPRLAGEINDFQVRLVKLRGEFEWHHHDAEDEFFLVTAGLLRMSFRDRDVDVRPGEFIIIPHGIEHRPAAPLGDCHVVLIERASTINTGNVVSDRTVAQIEALAVAGNS